MKLLKATSTLLLCIIAVAAFGQSIHIPLTVGAVNRNTRTDLGLQVEDTLLAKKNMAIPNGSLSIGNFTFNPKTSIYATGDTGRGVIINRLTTAQQNAISSPPNGLLIYNTDSASICRYDSVNANWRQLAVGSAAAGATGATGPTGATGATGATGGFAAESLILEDLQSRATNDSLIAGTVYHVTDVAAGLYVLAVNANTVQSTTTLYQWVPDYTEDATYKGQLLPTSTVNLGERWVWGNRVWENTSGSNNTTNNDFTLPGSDWTLVTESDTSGYILTTFIAEFDLASGLITKVTQPDYQNTNFESSTGQGLGLRVQSQWSNGTFGAYIDNTGYMINNRVDATSQFFRNINNGISQTYLRRNEVINGGILSGNIINMGKIENNTVDGGILTNNCVYASSEISGNTIIAGSDGTAISHLVIYDNCTVNDNTVTGFDAAIWDIIGIEGCHADGNVLSGELAVVNDFYLTLSDSVTNNVLYGYNTFMAAVFQLERCAIDGCLLLDTNAYMLRIKMANSKIYNYVVDSTCQRDVYMQDVDMVASTIINASNIIISNLTLKNCYLDLTGWARDIENETIEHRAGRFTALLNLADTLAEDSSLYIGYLPTGAHITNIVFIVDGTDPLTGDVGAQLQVDLETDDTGLIPATAIGTLNTTPQLYNNISDAATAARSVQIMATGGQINSGTVSISVQFVY